MINGADLGPNTRMSLAIQLAERLKANLFPPPEKGRTFSVRVVCSRPTCSTCLEAKRLLDGIMQMLGREVNTMDEELKVAELESLSARAEAESKRTDLDTVELGWVQQLATASRELAQFRKQRLEKAGGCTCQEQAAPTAP